jgi:hypothetical protein
MPPIILPSKDSTLGALFLGSTFASICYGMTIIQVVVYFHSYPNDHRLYKLAAILLWLLDSGHFVVSIHAVYHYVVGNVGHHIIPIEITWSVRVQVVINVVIVLFVQSLYAIRVWKLSGMHRGFLGYIAAGVIFIGFTVGIVLCYEVFTLDTLLDIKSISWAIIATFATASGIDLIIAAAIFICIRRTQSVLPSLSSKLMSLVAYTLVSGLLTSLCALAALLCYLFMPYNLVFYAVGFVLTRLYITSFLALLNARPRNSSERSAQNTTTTLQLTTYPGKSSRRSTRGSRIRPLEKNLDSPIEPAPSVYSVSTSPSMFKEEIFYFPPEDVIPRAI